MFNLSYTQTKVMISGERQEANAEGTYVKLHTKTKSKLFFKNCSGVCK